MFEKINNLHKTVGEQRTIKAECKLRARLILLFSYKTSPCDETYEVALSIPLSPR